VAGTVAMSVLRGIWRDRGKLSWDRIPSAGAVTNDGTLSSVDTSIPPVLDRIVAAARKSPGDLGPPLPDFSNEPLDQFPLFGGNGLVVECGLQVLMEALPALFGRPSSNQVRNANPVVRTMGLNELEETSVLNSRPRAPSASSVRHCRGVLK
jgi:hypothetical protein